MRFELVSNLKTAMALGLKTQGHPHPSRRGDPVRLFRNAPACAVHSAAGRDCGMRIGATAVFVVALVLGVLAAPLAAGAQQPEKVRRVGWLGNSKLNTPETIASWDAFRLELQRKGWSEGRNLAFEQRFANGDVALFPQHARELVELKVEVIMATSGSAAAAAKKATASIPVIFATVPDPVETGLVASLAHPGGNLTGFSTQGIDLAGKRLELLKEAFPRIVRVAYLPLALERFNEPVHRAAEKLGIHLLSARVTQPEDLVGAIAALAYADAWFVAEHLTYFARRHTILDAIARQRKPAMYPSTFFVRAGGLMSYSVDQKDHYRSAAGLVDRILRGAKPADLPVEQPTKFELVINLKTARALGLTVPQSVLIRADKVIR